MRSKIQISQNKCIRFCLQLGKMAHVSQKWSEAINWLPIKKEFNKSINSIVFKYFDEQCPYYLNKACAKSPESGLSLRNSYHKLTQQFRNNSVGHNTLSFIGLALWDKIPKEIKAQLAWTCLNKLTLRNTYLNEIGQSSFYKKLLLLILL